MKYIDAERLKAEIKRLQCEQGFEDGMEERGYQFAIKDILDIIDSLQQEQPEADLKKEIKEWVDLMVGASFPEQQDGDFISKEDYRSVIRQTAIHFLCLNAKKEE